MHPTIQKAGAWFVHLFTSSGIVAGFYSIVCISQHDFVSAMWLLFLCLLIDGIDGTFARLFKVTETLPLMDGKAIDYVVDFATYAIIPTYMMYEAGIFPESLKHMAVVIILLVSAIYYGKMGMVSDDKHFIGFPVMWNMVAFYLVFITKEYSMFNFVAVVFLGILHFVPIKFAYPSQSTVLFVPTLVNSVLCVGSCLGILYLHPIIPLWLVALSVGTVIYFAIVAIWATWFK